MRLFVLVALACGTLAFQGEDWRLIRLNEEIEFWMSPEQIDALPLQNINFIDVTDTYDLEKIGEERIAKGGHSTWNYPTAPAHQTTVENLAKDIDLDAVARNLQTFSDFHNRRRDSQHGVESAQWLLEFVEAEAGAVAKVRKVSHRSFPQFSVIARIEPVNSTNTDVVVIGAHEDSTAGGGAQGRAPGADDDGSGSIVILDIFSIVVNAIETGVFRPKRPIEFQWYAGEEGGLVGSGDISRDYASRGVEIYSMLQLDMVGYGNSNGIGIIQDHTNAALTQFIRVLIDSYLSIGYTNSRCGYGCSDHASFTRAGYPSAFPFETPFGQHNPHIHTARDTLDKLDLNHVGQFSRLAVAYLVETTLA